MTTTYKHVRREVDRHGKVRFYYRKDNGPRIALPEPDDPDFADRYAVAAASTPVPKRPKRQDKPTLVRATRGTLGWLCQEFWSSAEFAQLGQSTQTDRRRIVEACLMEPIAPGASDLFKDFPLDELTPKAFRVLRDRKKDLPNAANGRLKAFRRIFKWGLEAEPDIVKWNPARDVSFLFARSDGYHSWTIEEVEKFEKRHPVGTRARLALAILLYTGQRRSDIVRFGEPMVKDEWLHFRQWKNRNRSPVDMSLPVVPELRRIIRATRMVGTTTWLVTEFGKPYAIAGFGNRFRDWCNQSGLPHCSAHGLRKATASRLAELGCSDRHIMAITGHRTAAEVDRYTRGARQRKMAEAASVHLGR